MVWLFIATTEMVAQKRDTLPLLSRSLEHATTDVAMLRYYHENVALHHLLYPSSLSTFGTEYQSETFRVTTYVGQCHLLQWADQGGSLQ